MIVAIAHITVPYGAAETGVQTPEERIRRLRRLGYITEAQTVFLSRHSIQTQVTSSYQDHCLDIHIFLKDPDPRIVTLARLLF